MSRCARYFFHAGYHGWRYRGWQRQEGFASVQETLEQAFSRIFKMSVTVNGCGRTDAKVSASQYFFHADLPDHSDFDLLFRLNKVLPDDIAIFDIFPVEDHCHARFDATQRTYDYFIHTYKDPFLSTMSSMYLVDRLDIDKMKAAVALFPLYSNYHSFCRSPEKHHSTICNISSASLFTDAKGERFRIQISSNRFLKTMVRMLAGKVLEVGKGELGVDALEHCLRTNTAPPSLMPAYPQGLFLSKVSYPYLDVAPRADFNLFSRQAADEQWIPA